MAPALAQAQTRIGNASKAVDQVKGSPQENVRTIATQDDVFQNEVVKTASESATQLIFKDETRLTIGPESKVTLDTFVYDSSPDKGRLVINQTVGTLRFVSGAFSDKNYGVRTLTATDRHTRHRIHGRRGSEWSDQYLGRSRRRQRDQRCWRHTVCFGESRIILDGQHADGTPDSTWTSAASRSDPSRTDGCNGYYGTWAGLQARTRPPVRPKAA